MAQLTEFGFERENRTDITARVNSSFRNKFGANLLLTDDSIAGLLRSVIAERSLEFEKLLEDVYYARTLNGAEGIALDDAASYYGFLRRGPQPSSGVAHIEFVDDGSNLGTSIDTSYTFQGSNGLSYVVSAGGTLNQHISGVVIDSNVLDAGVYTFFITNVIAGGVSDTTITLAGTEAADIEAFNINLISFILSNTIGNVSSVFQDAGVVYVGYGSTEDFIGLSQAVYFESPDFPTGFTWWAGYDVTATSAGFNTLEAGGIASMSPTFAGYVSATSTVDFDPGAENETDAEFRFRIQTSTTRTPVGTRDRIVEVINAVDGVDGVRIYDNPTPADLPQASALTFNAIVRGGVSFDIASAIYGSKPIGRNTSGTTLVNIPTADGEIEEVRFTQAVSSEWDLRISYVSNNTSPLNARELQAIRDNIVLILENQPIGQSVTNAQLESAVLGALAAGRLLRVEVEVKKPEAGSSSFIIGDLEANFDEYLGINSYEFVRSV